MNKAIFLILLFLITPHTSFSSSQKIVTIQTINYPPYITLGKDKEVGGITYIIINEIFKSAGYKTKFKVVSWKRAVHNLFRNKDSIMTGVFSAIPNYKRIPLTQIGYMNFPTTYFYNAKNHPEFAKINRIEETRGKKVAVMGGTKIYEDVITKSGGKIIKVSSAQKVFEMLNEGTVHFAHSALISTLQSIEKDPENKDITPFKFNITNLVSGLIFREGVNNIKDDFLFEVKKLYKNGILHSIFKKALLSIPTANVESLYPKKIEVKVNTPQ
jgi:ABC-type amino acid transport substrate-binding protein